MRRLNVRKPEWWTEAHSVEAERRTLAALAEVGVVPEYVVPDPYAERVFGVMPGIGWHATVAAFDQARFLVFTSMGVECEWEHAEVDR